MIVPSFAEADARLVSVAKNLHILREVAWPEELCEWFLAGWRKGQPRLPSPPAVEGDLDEELAALEELSRPVGEDPRATFISQTARSYATAIRMLRAAGTPDFSKYSIELYGQPSDPVGPSGVTNLAAAEHFLQASADLRESGVFTTEDLCLTPEHVRGELARRAGVLFVDHPVKVELDPSLVSKAAAGAERIRLRSATCFSSADLDQLWNHEACVHTATALNGRSQAALKSLSLGAPRTTATQEGLATFSELITGSIDLSRLRRLALRVKAIHMALEGADFVQVFEFFLNEGQGEKESFYSAARVFRGGDPRGGVPFTKDGVYLHGLLDVHMFMHRALSEDPMGLRLARTLFVGRLTCADAVVLAPLVEDGSVQMPRYEPSWLSRRAQLAAYLACSSLMQSLGAS